MVTIQGAAFNTVCKYSMYAYWLAEMSFSIKQLNNLALSREKALYVVLLYMYLATSNCTYYVNTCWDGNVLALFTYRVFSYSLYTMYIRKYGMLILIRQVQNQHKTSGGY